MTLVEGLLLAVAALMVVACGAFVAAEFAFITVNRAAVEAEARKDDSGAKGILSALRTLSTQLSGAQLGITITNLAIGFLAEPSLAALLDGPLASMGLSTPAARSVSVVLALVIATALTMLFGELIPKNMAIARPMGTARAVQAFMRGFSKVTGPVIRLFNGTANRILLMVGVEPQEELASARSAEELGALVRHSAREGTLAADTAQILERSLIFGDLRAHDVMTARRQMTVLDPDDSVHDLIELSRTSGFSRFPVIEEVDETVDRVAGFAHIRRALTVPYDQRRTTKVSAVITEPVVVPDTVELDDLLDQLRAGGLQMAVLIDEFGSIAGLVTLEDLIEELVGEVHDEHDREDHPVEGDDGTYTVSGLMRPDEVSELIGVPLPEDEDYETISGLITVRLGRFPELGDQVEVELEPRYDEPDVVVHLEVVAVEETRAERVRVRVEQHAGDDS